MSNGFGSPSQQNNILSKGLRPAIDAETVQQQWLSQFEDLEDPRGLQGQEHAFLKHCTDCDSGDYREVG